MNVSLAGVTLDILCLLQVASPPYRDCLGPGQEDVGAPLRPPPTEQEFSHLGWAGGKKQDTQEVILFEPSTCKYVTVLGTIGNRSRI